MLDLIDDATHFRRTPKNTVSAIARIALLMPQRIRSTFELKVSLPSDVKLERQFRLAVHRGRYENVAYRIGKPDRHWQAVVVKTRIEVDLR